jgi:hypothetical protein
MVSRYIAALAVSLYFIGPLHASAATFYADGVDASFERGDQASENKGYFNCELNLAIVKLPTGVDLRVKLLKHGDTLFPTATVDVAEFTMSNGIPYNPRRIPIVDAGIVSNLFETAQHTKQVDMGDGGIGIVLTAEQFALLMVVIVRGDYLVTYLAKGVKESTAFVVHEGVNSKVFEQFHSCTKKML